MKADNTLPSGIHELMNLAGDIAEGLRRHGPFLKMTQVPEAEFRALLERLRHAETLYSEARVAKAIAGGESTAANAALTKWLVRTRGMLTIDFGQRWSERWLQAGFNHRRTNVPKRMEPRIALARSVVDFLGRHPEHERLLDKITGKSGRASLDRMLEAQRALREAKASCIARKKVRDATERALRRKMRQVVVILGVTIRPEDARWLDFGLNRPLRSLGARPAAGQPAELPAIETLPVAPASPALSQAVAA